MKYRNHRPWIFSFVAIAFVVIAYWYARPKDQPQDTPPANTNQPAIKHNSPPSIGPAPGNSGD